MSAEDEKDLPGETPAQPPAASKRSAAKGRAAAKDTSANAPSAKEASAKGASAKEAVAKEAGTEEPAAKETAAEKPAAKKAAARKSPAPAKGATAAKPSKEADGKSSRRTARRPTQVPRRRVVRAHARYVRTSARKARMVCGHLRGKSVQEARAILAFTPREVARDWSKLLESAVANAESNHELLEDDLIVREAYADEGPTIKRFRPRAMGRATSIRKRTSHLTITLTPGS